MWVFAPFSRFIFFLNPAADKTQIIKLFILLCTLKSALFKEINIKATKSADLVLSVEKASGHGCFSQIGYRYMNHCSVFLLLSLPLSFFFFLVFCGFMSIFAEQSQSGDAAALTWAARQLFIPHLVRGAFGAVAARGPVGILWWLLLLVQQLLGPSAAVRGSRLSAATSTPVPAIRSLMV